MFLSPSAAASTAAVTNKHHFGDGPLLYQFRMNFRRRRRLMELLAERGRIPESHDSPFCLRKQNSDGGNTSFLSGGSGLLPMMGMMMMMLKMMSNATSWSTACLTYKL